MTDPAPAARGVPVELRGLSLTQPWATLIAIGAKHNETRSWKTDYRGWVAIHASKRFPREARALLAKWPLRDVLAPAGYSWHEPDRLPTSAIVAVVKLTDCYRAVASAPSQMERAFGDYGAGRYVWSLDLLTKLQTPIPCAGALSLWPVHETLRAALSREIPWLR